MLLTVGHRRSEYQPILEPKRKCHRSSPDRLAEIFQRMLPTFTIVKKTNSVVVNGLVPQQSAGRSPENHRA
jgi:hypothetical protein